MLCMHFYYLADIYVIWNSILSLEPLMVIILEDYYCFESMMRIIATTANAIGYLCLMGS